MKPKCARKTEYNLLETRKIVISQPLFVSSFRQVSCVRWEEENEFPSDVAGNDQTERI